MNPQIDNQFLLFHGMSESTVILHVETTSTQADTESVVGSARTHFAISIKLHVPLKRQLLCRWAGRIWVEFRNSLLFEIMAKLMKMRGETDIESEGVDVVFGAPALAISGCELQDFIFSETVRGKGLDGHTLSEGVVNTTRPLQCEFSNVHSSLAFGLLELYGAHSYFPQASNQRAPLHEDDFVRLLCFSVFVVLGNHLFVRISPGPLELTRLWSEFGVVAPISEEDVRKGGSK